MDFPRADPPDTQFVTLSEAISWIAFQHSMTATQLAAALGMGEWDLCFDTLDNAESDAVQPVHSLRRGLVGPEGDSALAQAVERLTDVASGGEIEIRGRFFRSVLEDDRQILIKVISQEALSNYRQFDVFADALYRGNGLAWGADRRDFPATTDDHFRDVIVRRSQLLQHFPPQSGYALRLTSAFDEKCETWLTQKFAADPKGQLTKSSLKKEAIAKFGGRLSQRGFDRVWDKVAPSAGRNKPGAKSKH